MSAESSKPGSTCPRCGTALTADEAGGRCPRCLANALFAAGASRPALAPSPAAIDGRRVGDYELLEEIARGGMGIVYRARQVSLDRIVAVKLMRDSALAGTDDVRRFKVEAGAAAKLKHPHIVAIHEVGEKDGQHYFAMDLVEGGNLAERTREGPLAPRAAAALVATIADAVQHAHERGILHRDLKPSNVLLDGDYQPFVTDFGLARTLEGDSSLTLTGQVLGTPGYMPPEQATGRGTVGPAADIYSLGALLYHLLTGRAPFVGGTPAETMRHVVEQEPVSPKMLNPEVPRDLVSVCLKCLAKRPVDRYGAAAELAEDLRRFVRGEPTVARPAGPRERAVRWARRNPTLALAGAAIASVVLASLSVVSFLLARERATSKELRDAVKIHNRSVVQLTGRMVNRPVETNAAGFPVVWEKTPTLGRVVDAIYLQDAVDRAARVSSWDYAASNAWSFCQDFPGFYPDWDRVAALLVQTERRMDYETLRGRILARARTLRDALYLDRLAKACLLLPVGDPEPYCVLADRALAENTDESAKPWLWATKSLAEYRRGNFQETVAWGERSLSFWKKGSMEHSMLAELLVAAGHARANHLEQARFAWKRHEAAVVPYRAFEGWGGGWHNVLVAEILDREMGPVILAALNKRVLEPVTP